MNGRERFLRWMTFNGFEDVDRPPIWETIGFWSETLDRWRTEGLPSDLGRHPFFGFLYGGSRRDMLRLIKCIGLDHIETIQINFGLIPQFAPEVIFQDQNYIIARDGQGITKKTLAHGTSMPQFLEYPIKNRADFYEVKSRLRPDEPKRLPPDWGEVVAQARERDFPLGLFVHGFFGEPRELMGLENWLFMHYDDPGFVEEILDFWLDFLIALTSRLFEETSVDFVCLWEDMCYHTGPLLSPDMFSKFILPRYREFTSHLRKNGVQVILVDCDGNLDQLLDLFLAGGIDGVYPLEVQAGNDPVALREKYKRLVMLGGVDKRVLPQGPIAVRKELERIRPVLATGGYIPCLDHAVPPDVSLIQYRQYLEELGKIYLSY